MPLTTIKIKYFNPDMPEIQSIDKGDWIDLRVNKVDVCINEEDAISDSFKTKSSCKWGTSHKISYKKGFVV